MADIKNFRLRQLHGRLGDLVYQFTKVQFSQGAAPEKWAPPINAYRCEIGFAICVDLSGIDKSEIHLEVQPRLIRVQGNRAIPEPKGKENEPKQILAMEIDSGPFEREISLPLDVETNAVRAEYMDGFLWIYLPYRSQG